jgi:transcription antitermination factor NusG
MIWLAVHTKPSKEALANFYIERLGIETFFPHYEAQWSPESKRLSVLARRAFLPRYTFAYASTARVAEINELPWVSVVLHRAGGQPCSIPEVVISELFKYASEKTGVVYRNPPSERSDGPLEGDQIRLGEKSPLFGFRAVVTKVIDNRRILAKLDSSLFGVAGREIEVPLTEIGEIVPVGGALATG